MATTPSGRPGSDGLRRQCKAVVKIAPWRDPIVRWLDAASRRAARRMIATLWKIEEKSLQSQGENLVSARRKARRSALAMVATAAEIRESIVARARHGHGQSVDRVDMHEAAVKPEKVLLEHERGLLPTLSEIVPTSWLVPSPWLLGSQGAVPGRRGVTRREYCLDASERDDFGGTRGGLVEAAKAGDVEAIQTHAAGGSRPRPRSGRPADPARSICRMVPPALLALVSSFGAGVGGLILIVSSLFGGIRITVFAIPGRRHPRIVHRVSGSGLRRTRPRASSRARRSRHPGGRACFLSQPDEPTWLQRIRRSRHGRRRPCGWRYLVEDRSTALAVVERTVGFHHFGPIIGMHPLEKLMQAAQAVVTGPRGKGGAGCACPVHTRRQPSE